MRLMGHLSWFSWRMLAFAQKGSYMMKVSHFTMLLRLASHKFEQLTLQN
jgi:hypothetical protein